MIREVLQEPDERLHQVAEAVPPSPEVSTLIADMFETADSLKAIGLAAPQVGVPWRVIIVRVAGLKLAMIDPQYEWNNGSHYVTNAETCLSVPGVAMEKIRHKRIVATWTDEAGVNQRQRFEGWQSIVIQHEIDHLDGVTLAGRRV